MSFVDFELAEDTKEFLDNNEDATISEDAKYVLMGCDDNQLLKITKELRPNIHIVDIIPINTDERWSYEIEETDKPMESTEYKPTSKLYYLLMAPLFPLLTFGILFGGAIGGGIGGGLFGGGIGLIGVLSQKDNIKKRNKILISTLYLIIAWLLFLGYIYIVILIFT